jgi:hypothetical protein
MPRNRDQNTRTPERPASGRGEDEQQTAKQLEKAEARNDRRLKKSSKPGRGVTGDEDPGFAVTDRDRGPVGTRGRGKAGHSKPGRR